MSGRVSRLRPLVVPDFAIACRCGTALTADNIARVELPRNWAAPAVVSRIGCQQCAEKQAALVGPSVSGPTFWTPSPVDRYGNVRHGDLLDGSRAIVEVSPAGTVLAPDVFAQKYSTLPVGDWVEVSGPARMVSFAGWAQLVGFRRGGAA